jgi:hypothetical protein
MTDTGVENVAIVAFSADVAINSAVVIQHHIAVDTASGASCTSVLMHSWSTY